MWGTGWSLPWQPEELGQWVNPDAADVGHILSCCASGIQTQFLTHFQISKHDAEMFVRVLYKGHPCHEIWWAGVILDSVCGLVTRLRKEPFEGPLPIIRGCVLIHYVGEYMGKGYILVYIFFPFSVLDSGELEVWGVCDSPWIRRFSSEINDELMPELGKEGIDGRLFLGRRRCLAIIYIWAVILCRRGECMSQGF